MTCSLHPCLDFSWFTSSNSLNYACLTSSTSLVDNDFCTYHFFLSFKPEIKLKIEVRSITRVVASIWVKLDDLSFLYYINYVIYVTLEPIFLAPINLICVDFFTETKDELGFIFIENLNFENPVEFVFLINPTYYVKPII